MIIFTQSLLSGMTEMMNISRNGCVLSNIDCQPNKSIFKLLFQMYLVTPNRGAIYLFHTNTPKKKPILKVIGGLVYLVLAEDFWRFTVNFTVSFSSFYCQFCVYLIFNLVSFKIKS